MNQINRTSSAKRWRTLSASALITLAGFVATAHGNEYWDEFGALPVEIKQGAQTLTFVDFKEGMLIAALEGGVGEVSMPVNESLVQSLSLDLGIMPRANDLIRQENFEGAITLMRPKVYPLVKFHQVPELFTQLHVPVRALIDTLVSAGKLEEADFIVKQLRLEKADLKYSNSAIRLMNAQIASGDYETAALVAQTLPVDGIYTPNIRALINTADSLRAAEKYEEVIPLYRSIELAVSEEMQNNVRMWLAYCLLLANRMDEAGPMIDKLEEPDPKDRLFSLYKLVQGTREFRSENYPMALDLLTRGFVRAQTSYIWVPEMLYFIGDCYNRAQDQVAAYNVWTEVAILYPDSPWAARAEKSLATLPQPERPERPSPVPAEPQDEPTEAPDPEQPKQSEPERSAPSSLQLLSRSAPQEEQPAAPEQPKKEESKPSTLQLLSNNP